MELSYNVGSCDENQGKDRLNFGLMEVVYEWARNKVSLTEKKSNPKKFFSHNYL